MIKKEKNTFKAALQRGTPLLIAVAPTSSAAWPDDPGGLLKRRATRRDQFP
jgi:hypothetical protein